MNSTLIPGEIVEETENEDLSATIDLSFHEDIELIKSLGATEMPPEQSRSFFGNLV